MLRKRIFKIILTVAAIFTLSLTVSATDSNSELEKLISVKNVEAKGLQIGINRIYGNDVYETNMQAIVNLRQKASKVIVVSGQSDYVGREAVDLAFSEGLPIVLTEANNVNNITSKTIAYLNAKEVVIVGNTNEVSQNVENILKKNYKVSRVNPNELYPASELAKVIPEGNKNARITYISTNSLPDFLSGINHQSIGGQRVIPANTLSRSELNKHKAVDIVGSIYSLDVEGREYPDQNTVYSWEDAGWIITNNQRLDAIYQSYKPEVLSGKRFRITYVGQPIRINLGTKAQYPDLLDAVHKRYLINFGSLLNKPVYFDSQGNPHFNEELQNHSTYDYNTQIYTPKFSVTYSVQDYAYQIYTEYIVRSSARILAKDNLDDVEKLRAIYEWIGKRTVLTNERFDQGVPMKNNHKTTTSIFFTKKGDCLSMSETFNNIAKAAGFRTFKETGIIKGSGHAWSLVMLNNNIYAVDITGYKKNDGIFLDTPEQLESYGYKLG